MKFLNLLLILFLAAQPLFAQGVDEEEAAPEPAKVIRPDAVETTPLRGIKVSLTTEDGKNIKGVYFSPEPQEPAEGEAEQEPEAVKYVVLLHDLGKNKSSFYSMSESLRRNGFGFIAVDLRGHGESAGEEHYTKFAREGINNQFNQMVKDLGAAVNYLKGGGIKSEQIFVAGAGLGANVAAKSMLLNQDLAGFALFTPTSNNRDVLTIQGVRVNKKPIFIGVASDAKKQFFDASIIRNNAFLTMGAGLTTFATAYNKEGTEMMQTYLMPVFIQWLKTPRRPDVKPDEKKEELSAETEDGLIVLPEPSFAL